MCPHWEASHGLPHGGVLPSLTSELLGKSVNRVKARIRMVFLHQQGVDFKADWRDVMDQQPLAPSETITTLIILNG